MMTPEKVEFVWNEPQPLARTSGRLRFAAADDPLMIETFAAAVRGSLAGTLDREDAERVARGDAEDVLTSYLAPDDFFVSDARWWRIAFDGDDRVVGFSQPVLFRGCAREGKEEGTLHYIGVLPETRGKGYIDDILLDATAQLQRLGVWRIACDTDATNRPMIAAFERCGYLRVTTP